MNMFQRLSNEQDFNYEIYPDNAVSGINLRTKIVINPPNDIMWLYSKDDNFVVGYYKNDTYTNLAECISKLNEMKENYDTDYTNS